MTSSVELATNSSAGWRRPLAYASVKITTHRAFTSPTSSRKRTIECPTPGKLSLPIFFNRHKTPLFVTADFEYQLTPFPVCRLRIHQEFKDGDSCTVTLKDRFKPQTDDDKLWYERAFGSLRNIMKFDLTFTPPSDQVTPGKFKFFAQVHYNIFPEMMDEFGESAYSPNEMIPLEVEKIDDTHHEYFLELERPYGECSANIWYVDIEQQEQSETPIEPTALNESLFDYFN